MGLWLRHFAHPLYSLDNIFCAFIVFETSMPIFQTWCPFFQTSTPFFQTSTSKSQTEIFRNKQVDTHHAQDDLKTEEVTQPQAHSLCSLHHDADGKASRATWKPSCITQYFVLLVFFRRQCLFFRRDGRFFRRQRHFFRRQPRKVRLRFSKRLKNRIP